MITKNIKLNPFFYLDFYFWIYLLKGYLYDKTISKAY
jgi:hypothetical protein